jgi:hypothetical protein
MEPGDIPVVIGLPEADLSTLKHRLMESIARRRDLAAAQGLGFDQLASGAGLPALANEDPLAHLTVFQDRICVQPSRVDRFLTGIRLVDDILTRLRREVHNVAIFYCNRLGQRQMLFNRALVRLMVTTGEREQTVEALNVRLAQLEARIAELERQFNQRVQ